MAKQTYRIVQREVIFSMFHVEAKSAEEARKMVTGTLSAEVIEAMGYAEQETESVETIEVTALDDEED